jgi:AraC-like DNA-binding protein
MPQFAPNPARIPAFEPASSVLPLSIVETHRALPALNDRTAFPLALRSIDEGRVTFVDSLRKIGQMTALTMSTQTGFRAEPTGSLDVYGLSFTTSGTAVRCGASVEATSSPGTGSIYHLPDLEWIDVSPQFKTWGLFIERELLDRQYEALTGESPNGRIKFVPVIELTSRPLKAFVRSVRILHEAIMMRPQQHGLDFPLLQELLIQQLLTHWPRVGDDVVTADASSAGTLGRAREFIAANLTTPITVADVASAAGVSVRALQMAFRRELDQSPLSFILAERLDLAHAQLHLAGDARAVSQIAYGAGFLHMSDFSRRYRERFGCTPTETRRNRQP